MQIVYAFVYYFLLLFLGLTFSLAIFVFRPFRKLLHKVQTKFKNIFNNSFLKYFINFSFAIIFLILADSVRSFYAVNQHINSHDHEIVKVGIERFDIVKEHDRQSYLGVLKEHRQLYMAQRNIMLTCSALFVYFVFQRLTFNIRKLANEEHMQQNPGAESVILQKRDSSESVKDQSVTPTNKPKSD